MEIGVASDFLNLGLALERKGELDQAIAHYRQAALLDPDLKFAHFCLGNALMKQAKFGQAAASYVQELRINPESYAAMTNLGNALRKSGKLEHAVACYQKSIALQSSRAECGNIVGDTFNNLGITYNDLGRLDEAIASFRQAILHRPTFIDAYVNIATPLLVRGGLEDSAQYCKKALELQPDCWRAHMNLGNAYKRLGLFNQAAASYQRAISLTQENGGAYSNLGETLKEQGKLHEAAESFEKAIAARPVFKPAYSNLLYFYAFTRHVSPVEARIVAEGWEKYFLTESERLAARDRARAGGETFPAQPRYGRKLRLGIVTAELCTHAVAEFLQPFVEELDRNRFALTMFPTLLKTDSRARLFRQIADRNGDGFLPLCGIPAATAAERIRSKQIDVLIETTGHTYDNSLEIIAHRAAPVQCSYIGYWSTTGLTEMDWFITGTGVGSFIDPHFREGLWRLPRLSFCYKGDPGLAENGWAPDPDGTIWLGSFNNNAKIREETLRLWAKVLHALPEAKLLFEDRHVRDEETHQRLALILLSLGVDESRFHFIPYERGHERHMKLYDLLDVALDTIPFNSVTTAFDALWMGVPLVTLAGTWLGGILAGSFLQALDHPEWIAQNEEEYVSIVCSLARDVEKRRELRKNQRARMHNSELCDAKGLARSLEAALEAMHDRWLESAPPGAGQATFALAADKSE
jgi:protein O-GlcNAc transferase